MPRAEPTADNQFMLRIPSAELRAWSARYGEFYDDSAVEEIGRAACRAGYLTSDQFLAMAHWKSPRTQPRCRQNSDAYVREVTAAAFATSEPRFKIEVLRLLDGVDWPTASVILHFCDRERWPILDFRALWSLGREIPPHQYTFPIWKSYAESARGLADTHGLTMRDVDRALWAYSKVNQV